MHILSLGYLGFESPRFEEWMHFGPEVMGLAPGGRGPDGAVLLKMDERNFRLAMHPGSVDRLSYIGWEVRDERALAAVAARLESKRMACSRGTDEQLRARGVAGMLRVEDPAGFLHELYYGQAFWPHSFVPGRPMAGFLAGALGLGHVVLGVPQFTDELRAFALDVLGFSVFGTYRFPMPDTGRVELLEFYRCNPRTHVLGYVPYPGLRGIQHVGIDTLHLDDVGTCLDLCRKRKVPISGTLGRNVLDDTVSFYFLSPGGFEVEYGYGPRLIRDGDFVTQTPQHYPHIWGHELDPAHRATTLRPVDAAPPGATRP